MNRGFLSCFRKTPRMLGKTEEVPFLSKLKFIECVLILPAILNLCPHFILSPHFIPSPRFIPSLQSASPQSAFYSDWYSTQSLKAMSAHDELIWWVDESNSTLDKGEVMHNRVISRVDETNSVATNPIEVRRVDLGSRQDK